MGKIKIWIGAIILAALSFGLIMLGRTFNGFANWYSDHIYPLWVNTAGRLFSFLPVSGSEMILYILVIFIVFQVIRCIILVIRGQKGLFHTVGTMLTFVAAVCSILFCLYVLNCGINYYRTPFSEVSGISVEGYDLGKLIKLSEILTEDVNKWADKVERDNDGIALIGDVSVAEASVSAMSSLGEKYESLSGYYPNPKPVFISEILSYQQLTGVYSPFTVEANYNADMAAYNIPFTACHELSHLKGFMREDEANFIAYLACTHSEEAIFQYSGALLAWIYVTNELYSIDQDTFYQLRDQLNENVLKDMSTNSAFWRKYDGKVAEVANKVNDAYLKSNNQSEGVRTYARIVSLLMDYYVEDLQSD